MHFRTFPPPLRPPLGFGLGLRLETRLNANRNGNPNPKGEGGGVQKCISAAKFVTKAVEKKSKFSCNRLIYPNVLV